MQLLITFLISFLTVLQPLPVFAFFNTGKATAEFTWQVGHWVLGSTTISEGGTTIVDQIANGSFVEHLEQWEHAGATTHETTSPCEVDPGTFARIGSLSDEPQTLIAENQLGQVFSPGSDGWLVIEYCLVSWETLPLFDEPSFVVTLNDATVWEDAPTVGEENATNPFVSGWRMATIPINGDTPEILLRISAGNTIDPNNPTVAYIRSVSTVATVLTPGTHIEITPSLATQEIRVDFNEQFHSQYLAPFSEAPIQVPTTEFSQQAGVHQLTITEKNALGQTTQKTVHLLSPPNQPTVPEFWFEPAQQGEAVAYFTSPSDGVNKKVARYKIWQKRSDQTIQQVPIQAHSFLWHTPRIPGSQEYLLFQTEPATEYKLEIIDQYGQSTSSDWRQIQPQ